MTIAPSARRAWLAQVREEAIDPDLPIIDVHHHLWDRRENQAPFQTYLVPEYIAEFGGHKVVASVFADCNAMYRAGGPESMRVVGETEFVQGMAAMADSGLYGDCKVGAGIVAAADLLLGDRVEPVLEAHIAASPNRFRGIRFGTHYDIDPTVRPGRAVHAVPGMLADARVRAGLACLDRLGLIFDASLFYHQLPELTATARAMPGLIIVLGHLGGLLNVGRHAGRKDEVFEEWKKMLAELAACPNVLVKLGGMANPRFGFGWQDEKRPPTSNEFSEATRRYFLTCIELFGPARCMFESNYPVDKVSISFSVLWNAYKKMTANFAPQERAALFHGTAIRAYSVAV